MLGEGGTPLEEFEAAARKFLARDERSVDPKRYRAVIDSLDGDFSTVARDAQKAGEHLVAGNITAASWIARTCGMSISSAADRVCVGEQLESLPKVAAALSSGEISFQAASALCHLHERLGEHRDGFAEEEMLGFAREYSVSELRKLCRFAWHVANPDGFFKEAEADFTRRYFHISQLPDCMVAVDGVLDPVGGAPFETAVDVPRMRALRVRDKGCRVHGCDRPVNWSNPHHIVYRSRGGSDNLENLVLLCYYHHRQVHEGGWQVIKVGREFQFLPPERVVMRRARGAGYCWAAEGRGDN